MGVGWVNELIARLTQTPVEDHTSTNRTLNRHPGKFPLNAKIYADFSQADNMVGIYSALGLFGSPSWGPRNIPTDRIANPKETAEINGFSASMVATLGARMYVEKMKCSSHKEELVRILINERVWKLPLCGADGAGRCTLSKFLDSLAFARTGGRWDQCFPKD
ncbi:hypothetical protein MCOR27_009907 [Pyricularia oryzae]|uniref:Uncharacterized protein n=2 Tax=Pyricularia TaxID=48558 RepID=A0ABQ8NLY9_PYRGI|nr:hypothetical protein MCOR01_011406 [Pyricularia oryzae]KAI6298931.1 hypothetical protein MCOR33_005049 [Pyricularia grisea]KAI6253838.1 hypothetical protein MCOR19_009626 [Pyricularia oryzae]KAI6264196.1 hypothetical protein MCOR26_011512 [Pyricularia oryzae]KAI6269046.1 hypothetical protein MCOR27_009907 [Pyricularia oryzae]